jgi:hypothetical protein
MQDVLRFFELLPQSLHTVFSMSLIGMGIWFLRDATVVSRRDRTARIILATGLLTAGIGWFSFLWGFILR